jgi:hypothetical protein
MVRLINMIYHEIIMANTFWQTGYSAAVESKQEHVQIHEERRTELEIDSFHSGYIF